MRFHKLGRSYQICLDSLADLRHVLELDESLWAATSAPTACFRDDARFLDLTDYDRDGRIRTDEIRQAIRWLVDHLSADALKEAPNESVAVCEIDPEGPQADTLVTSARFVLHSFGRDDPQDDARLTLADLRTFLAGVQDQPLNGDGVVRLESTDDEDLTEYLRAAIVCGHGTPDTNGEMGVSAAGIDSFQADVIAYADWVQRGKIPPGEQTTGAMPLGAATPGAWGVLNAHADKIDLFFDICRAGTIDRNLAGKLEADWHGAKQELDLNAPDAVNGYLAAGPIALAAGAGARLPLSGPDVNPAYAAWLDRLAREVLAPILGEFGGGISADQWAAAKQALAPYEAYLASKQGASVEGLPADQVAAYGDGRLHAAALALAEEDRHVARELDGVHELERLVLYRSRLLNLANNFVSFPQLYAEGERALFEMGSAVLDGRWFNFAVPVRDRAAHSQVAKSSEIFVAYLELTHPSVQGSKCVAVPVTSGTKGNLQVGKRGIFFDADGREFDARIVQVIESPISLREALAAPFVRLWGMVTSKVEGLYSSAEKGLQTQVADAVTSIPTAPAETPAASAGSSPAGMMVGISLALAALSSAFAYVTNTLAALDAFEILLGFLGAALVVIVPLTIIAVAKLRRQDLSALLEGCGWAVNVRMRLDRKQRKMFTSQSPYPQGASGKPWPGWIRFVFWWVVLVAVLAGAVYGARKLSAYQRERDAEAAQDAPPQEETAQKAPADPASE